MFKLNMNALRASASCAVLQPCYPAKAAKAAKAANEPGKSWEEISRKTPKLAGLAGLAVSSQRECTSQPEPANDPTSAEPPALVQPPAPDRPAKPLKFLDWADGWRELDKAYQRHHWGCAACKAAGLGYGLRCGAGAALYRAYEDAATR